MSDNNAKAQQKVPGQPLSRVTWAYVCGVFTLGSMMFGLGASFIPLAFGVMGAVLSWQLLKTDDRLHGGVAGVMNLGGVIIWVTHIGPVVRRLFHI
jgi:hypothetical protein